MAVRFMCDKCGADITGKTNHCDVCPGRRPRKPFTDPLISAYREPMSKESEINRKLDKIIKLLETLLERGMTMG